MESTLGTPGWDGAYAAFPDSSCSLLCCETHTQNTERQVDATSITFALSFWVSSLEEWIKLTCICRWHSSVFQQGRVVTFPADLPGVVGQDTLGGEMISFQSLQWYYSKATFHIFDECALPGDGWIQRESKGFPLWGNTWVSCWSIPWYTEHRTSLPWSNAALCQGMLLLPAATASTHTSMYSSFTFQQEGGGERKGKKGRTPHHYHQWKGTLESLVWKGKRSVRMSDHLHLSNASSQNRQWWWGFSLLMGNEDMKGSCITQGKGKVQPDYLGLSQLSPPGVEVPSPCHYHASDFLRVWVTFPTFFKLHRIGKA